MDIEVRVIKFDEFDEFVNVRHRGFHAKEEKVDSQRSQSWARGELDRAIAAFDGVEMIGIGRNYSFDLTVPGGARISASAVSSVSVLATHRRRGVLTKIMAALEAESRGRAEPVSILTASEGSIYRRFGYGVTSSTST